MDHVELATPGDRLARGLLADVIVRSGESLAQLGNLIRPDFKHNIDIMGQSGLAVDAAGQRTYKQIRDPLLFQDMHNVAE